MVKRIEKELKGKDHLAKYKLDEFKNFNGEGVLARISDVEGNQ